MAEERGIFYLSNSGRRSKKEIKIRQQWRDDPLMGCNFEEEISTGKLKSYVTKQFTLDFLPRSFLFLLLLEGRVELTK